jgi:hypothetical protein
MGTPTTYKTAENQQSAEVAREGARSHRFPRVTRIQMRLDSPE